MYRTIAIFSVCLLATSIIAAAPPPLKNVQEVVESLVPLPLKNVGDVANVSTVEVTQILSDTEFLGTVPKQAWYYRGADVTRRAAIPPMDAKFVGWDTSDMTDGAKVEAGYIYNDGTTSYVTVLGAKRTVPVIKKVPRAMVEKARVGKANATEKKMEMLSDGVPRTRNGTNLQTVLELLPEGKEQDNRRLMSMYPQFFANLKGRGFIVGEIRRVSEGRYMTKVELTSIEPKKPMTLTMSTRDFRRRWELEAGDRIVVSGTIEVGAMDLEEGLVVLIDRGGRLIPHRERHSQLSDFRSMSKGSNAGALVLTDVVVRPTKSTH